MPMPVRDCSRLVEVCSFREKETNQTLKSGWFLDRYFPTRRTRAEKLELRKYMKGEACPLFYSGACDKPRVLKGRKQSVTVQQLTWPTIKAEVEVNGCDVDDHSVTPDGRLLMPGRERYDEAVNWEMMNLMDSMRLTHISEAVNVLKYGGYTVRGGKGPLDVMGTVDFKREIEKWDILSETGPMGPWNDPCSNPFEFIDQMIRELGRCGAAGGMLDVIHSPESWAWLKAFDSRMAKCFDQRQTLPQNFDLEMANGYGEVEFKGTSNGGRLMHFVSYAEYKDWDEKTSDDNPDQPGWVTKPVVDPGTIMVVNRAAFEGKRIFRTVTSDNAEQLPDNADFFMYDDPAEVYEKKCRAFRPWIEEYHLMIPGNIDAAQIACVVDPKAAPPCPPCENCSPAAEKAAA